MWMGPDRDEPLYHNLPVYNNDNSKTRPRMSRKDQHMKNRDESKHRPINHKGEHYIEYAGVQNGKS